MASCDKMVKCWDLASNQTMQVAAHDAPIKTCHWVKGSNYTCLMTGSWDKTLKVLNYSIIKIYYFVDKFIYFFPCFQFWDTRTPNPMLTLNLPERCYCADVVNINYLC